MKARQAQIQFREANFLKAYEKELLNKYLEYKGNIRVFIRSRPILPIDFKAYEGTRESFDRIQKSISIHNERQIELVIAPEGGK